MTIRVPLSEQIEEAIMHRDALAKAVPEKPHLLPRLHRSEATILSLTAYQAFEDEINRMERMNNAGISQQR